MAKQKSFYWTEPTATINNAAADFSGLTPRQVTCLWQFTRRHGFTFDWAEQSKAGRITKKDAIPIIRAIKDYEKDPSAANKNTVENILGNYIPGFTINLNVTTAPEPQQTSIINEPTITEPEPTPNPRPTPTPPAAGSIEDIIADAVLRRIEAKGGANIDERKVISLIEERLTREKVEYEVIHPDGSKTNAGKQHFIFPKVLKLAANRKNVMLVGPSGSGKSYLAAHIAKELGLYFAYKAVGPATTETHLMGYNDANGNYVETELFKCYSKGGLFLMDEIDAGNPGILTLLNNMTENGSAAFPCGMIEKHPDFILIAAANTYGHGADAVYCGRQPIDAATLERFRFITMDYDEVLERDRTGNDEWFKRVIRIRRAVEELKERVLVTPRASVQGAFDLELGFTRDEVEEMHIWKGINPDIKTRILNKVGVN